MVSLSRGSADLLPIAETDDRGRSCQEEWNEMLDMYEFFDGALITSLSIETANMWCGIRESQAQKRR